MPDKDLEAARSALAERFVTIRMPMEAWREVLAPVEAAAIQPYREALEKLTEACSRLLRHSASAKYDGRALSDDTIGMHLNPAMPDDDLMAVLHPEEAP